MILRFIQRCLRIEDAGHAWLSELLFVADLVGIFWILFLLKSVFEEIK